MSRRVDINCDMGESFGRFILGNDENVMPHISSANIACGYHAGDPNVMRATIRLAKKYGVGVGAHPGLPDMLGFGRREMKITPEELKNYLIYQTGALRAFTIAENVKMQHVKPHGVLYQMVERDESLAEATVEAILELDPELILLIEYGTKAYEIAKKKGIKVVAEAFADLHYGDDGRWIIEKRKVAWDPKLVAARGVSLAKNGRLETVGGKVIQIRADSFCIHGDGPNAPEVAMTLRKTLEQEGIEIAPLAELAV